MPVTRKLVILGDCMVGKSNVAIRFARDRFDPDTQPNFGAAFFECVRPHAGTPGGAVKWEIFDTSGQDRYRGMNAMYYTTAAAAMVCFDITDMDTFHSAKSWINELQRRGPRGLVIALVGTKRDLEESERRVPREDVDEMRSQPIVVAEVSAKASTEAAGGVQALFAEVADRIAAAERAAGVEPDIDAGEDGRSASGSFVGRVTGAVSKLVSSPRKGGKGGQAATVESASASASATSVAAPREPRDTSGTADDGGADHGGGASTGKAAPGGGASSSSSSALDAADASSAAAGGEQAGQLGSQATTGNGKDGAASPPPVSSNGSLNAPARPDLKAVASAGAASPALSPYQKMLKTFFSFGGGVTMDAAAGGGRTPTGTRLVRRASLMPPVERVPVRLELPFAQRVTKVSAGAYHSLAMVEDGRVYSFGFGDSGQLGHGNKHACTGMRQVDGLKDQVALDIAAGGFHSLVLAQPASTASASAPAAGAEAEPATCVWAFGFGKCGALGLGDRNDQLVPARLDPGAFGRVRGTPTPAAGADGLEPAAEASAEGRMSLDTPATISAGHWHSLVTTECGVLFAFGCSDHGRLGVAPKKPDRVLPTRVVEGGVASKFVTMAAAGGEHSLALTRDGHVFSWGRGRYGQLGHGNMTTSELPRQLAGINDRRITDIAAGFHHSLLLTESGLAISFGRGDKGRAGLGDELKQVRYQGTTIMYQPTPQVVALPWEKKGIALIGIAAGAAHSLLLGSDGTLLTFGDAANGALGLGDGDSDGDGAGDGVAAMPRAVLSLDDESVVVGMACGMAHSVALTADGDVYRFGMVHDEDSRKLAAADPVPDYHYDDELAELFS